MTVVDPARLVLRSDWGCTMIAEELLILMALFFLFPLFFL